MVTSFCFPTATFPPVRQKMITTSMSCWKCISIWWVTPFIMTQEPFQSKMDGNDDETPSASPVAGQATIPGVATMNPATNTAVITPSDNTLLPPMPEGYFFQVFFGFKLFGRFAPAEYQSALISTGNCVFDVGKLKSASGRAEQRKAAAKGRRATQERGEKYQLVCMVSQKFRLMPQRRLLQWP